MSHRRSTVKGSLSFANPTVRAWLFQILAVVAVVGIVGWLFHNTVTNLSNRGITSGFAFLDRGAGFGIVQHLIDYQQGDTYGRVFIVGLLNTLLVSALCIVFASVLGFFIGLARLSDNWLLRKLSTIYIEIFRKIPPLLQIFFWYFAVLRNLNRPGFPGEYFICELRLPDHYFRWKHNKLFLLLPEEYGPAFPAIVDCYTSPPTLVWPVPLLSGFSSSYGVLPPLCKDH